MFSFTTHMESCIRDFMNTFEQKMYPDIKEVPCETCVLRSDLIKEEANEYADARNPSVDELDAIIDLLYVVIGTNLTLNVPVENYRSGQLRMIKPVKQPIYAPVKYMTQDLDCRFPCPRIQFKTSSMLIAILLDIGKLMGYKLESAFDAVHKANMTKLWTSPPINCPELKVIKKPSGYVVQRADGKVIKSPTFQAADLNPYL